MINRIDGAFKELKAKRKKAFVAFITAGDPNMSTTKSLISKFSNLGVDIIELGVPFSDPLADGPTVQKASLRALKNKISLRSVLKLVKDVREKTKVPLVLLSYYNLLFKYGIEKFVKDATKSGVDGVVIPDLPPEEGRDLIGYARRYNLATIFLLAPTSTTERVKLNSSYSRGFIYYVSVTGVTGTRRKLPSRVRESIKLIKRFSKKPVCVGFGISSAKQASSIAKISDGVIVGSAIIKKIEQNLGSKKLVKRVIKFVEELRKAI